MDDAVDQFWIWFRGEADHLAAAARALYPQGGEASLEIVRARLPALSRRLGEAAPGLAPEISVAQDGVCALTLTAGGDVALFDEAYRFCDRAPYLPDWEFFALRPPRTPARFAAAGLAFDVSELRFAYRLANDRAVVAVLAEEAPDASHATRRAYAAGLVAASLGEEDFGRFVADAAFLEYETWLATTPQGRSQPLEDLAVTFQQVFAPARRRRKHDQRPSRLRLVG